MKHTINSFFIIIFVTLGVVGCGSQKEDTGSQMPAANTPAQPGISEPDITGIVLETMDAGGYTYIQIDTGSEKLWAAVTQREIDKGAKVGFSDGMMMPDFHSETLDRTFDKIYFVQKISIARDTSDKMPKMPMPGMEKQLSQGKQHSKSPDAAGVDFSSIIVPENGKSISDIYASSQDLSGKIVIARGIVVKYNAGIMGKNWIHLQDGSGSAGSNDITVTTSSTAKYGDTVVVEGKLTLDKDFGYGYKYDLLIEDAAVTVE